MTKREIDALLAEKVMGWTRSGGWPEWQLPIGSWRNGSNTATEPPHYSTSIEAVLGALEERAHSYSIEKEGGNYCVDLWMRRGSDLVQFSGEGATLPIAACAALLASVGIEL